VTVPQTIYSSDALVVRVLDPEQSDAAVLITFDSLQPRAGPPRDHGFGETAFARRGLSAVHVLDLKNRWYQTEDMEPALRCVRSFAARFARRTTYGASMGGYGALRHAAALNADLAIAMAPQWGLDPLAPPFDARWADDFHAHPRFQDDMGVRIEALRRAVIAYDPYHRDARHIDEYRRVRPDLDYLELPFTGHFPAGPLLDTGILADVAVQWATTPELDKGDLRRQFRRLRRQSASYWFSLADAASRHGHTTLSLGAIRRADELQPSIDRIAQQANIFADAGAPGEAIAFLVQRIRSASTLRDALLITSTLFHHLRVAGRLPEGADVLAGVLARFPSTPAQARHPDRVEEQRLIGRLQANLMDWPAAIAALRPVLRARPDDLEALRTASGAFMMLGYLPSAIALARRACRLAPFSADYHLHLGALLRSVHDDDAAARHLDRAASLASGRG
jgi:tetratricopeptide (TPR) repeat protein